MKRPVANISTDSDTLNDHIIERILDKKGIDVIKLDLRKLPEAVTDFFIICHGDSRTQVKAIADNLLKEIKEKLGERPWQTEGQQNAEWILVDYVSTVVHVFHKEKREFYQLEELWSDAKITKYSEEFTATPA